MKRIGPLALLAVLVLSVCVCGCIETGSRTTQAGTALAGYELVEHTYLIGSEGLFTKTYDIRIWILGSDVFKATGITKSDVSSYLQQYASPVTNPAGITPTVKPTEPVTTSVPAPVTVTRTRAPVVVSTTSGTTGVSYATSSLEVVGDVLGTGSGGTISSVNLTLALAEGATPVNMDDLTVTYSDSATLKTLAKTADMNTMPATGAWSVGSTINNNGAANKILDPGEVFVLVIKPPAPLGPNQKFSIDIKPPIGAPLVLSRTTPNTIAMIQALS